VIAWTLAAPFIPQELAYVPHLTVAENILLGRWPSWGGFTTRGAAIRRAREECAQFSIAMDVRRSMASLMLADRQIVEIVKALARRARLIVLDEPTASLSDQESRVLFDILGRLTRDGVGVIYISHRMDEVYRFSDRVDVFRNAQLVASGTATWSPTTLQRALRRADDGLPEVSTDTIWCVLHAADLSWQRDRSWCTTGVAKRRRKHGDVEVHDPDAVAKKG